MPMKQKVPARSIVMAFVIVSRLSRVEPFPKSSASAQSMAPPVALSRALPQMWQAVCHVRNGSRRSRCGIPGSGRLCSAQGHKWRR
jgi:hypothetical protein